MALKDTDEELLHNGGFCNGCILKQCLLTQQFCHTMLFLTRLVYDEKTKVVKKPSLLIFSEKFSFSYEGQACKYLNLFCDAAVSKTTVMYQLCR
jgi:hypothetical protein